MANVTIVKLKIRRGSDAQRKTIVLDQGEVGYTLDTRRIFVGDGVTEGGHSVGAKTVGPYACAPLLGPAAGESPGMQLGDLGYADSKLYALTSTIYNNALSGWAYIGNKPDGTLVDFVGGAGNDKNHLTIKKYPGAIESQHLSPAVFKNGLLSSYNSCTDEGTVEVGLNTNYLELSASGVGGNTNIIAPKADSIGARELACQAFGLGLQGGNESSSGGYNAICVAVNCNQLGFDANNNLEIKCFGNMSDGSALNMSTRTWAGACGQNIGDGLRLDSNCHLEAAVQGVDSRSPINISNGLLSLQGSTSSAQDFPFLETRQGIITRIQSSIYDVVTAQGLSGDAAGDGIPIGSIVPHAAAYTKIPAGYLLCDGTDVSRTIYKDLFDIIASTYGSRTVDTFTLPNLTGGNVGIYGAEGLATGANSNTPGGAGTSNTIYLSGTEASTYTTVDSVTTEFGLSATAVNFIIKALKDPLLNIFNGAPNQVSRGYLDEDGPNGGPVLENQVYECLDSSGQRTLLSSAGFIRFGLSGRSRDTDDEFDKFAIPVFNW